MSTSDLPAEIFIIKGIDEIFYSIDLDSRMISVTARVFPPQRKSIYEVSAHQVVQNFDNGGYYLELAKHGKRPKK